VRLSEQLVAVAGAPAALARLRSRASVLLLLYLGMAGLLLLVVGLAVASWQDEIRRAILGWFLPERYLFAGDTLVRYLLGRQSEAVLVSAISSGALVLTSLLLFPIKERLSARFEEESRLTDEPPRELPLWRQGLEELKLLLLYAAVFAGIFWIGYAPDPRRKVLAVVISQVFLCFTFAVDFICPLLQRHKLTYSRCLMALLRRPLLCLGFGALFAAPPLLAGAYWKRHPELSPVSAVLVLFGPSVLAMAWAAVSGTWVAARLLPSARTTHPASWPLRALAWLCMLAVLCWSGWVFAHLGAAIHGQSQLLKCHYRADWKSFGVSWPRLGVRSAVLGLVSGTVPLGAHLTVRIENPTDVDVVVERSRLEVRHQETLVALTRISPLHVPAGGSVDQRVDLTLELNPRALLKGRALISREWRLTLLLEISDDFEFPIYLLDPTADAGMR